MACSKRNDRLGIYNSKAKLLSIINFLSKSHSMGKLLMLKKLENYTNWVELKIHDQECVQNQKK